jgi:hypothetical protein
VVNAVNHGRTSTNPAGAIHARCDWDAAERDARHRRAVEQTLCWAQEAAADGAFDDALEWLRVVEVVDRALPPGWERTKQFWVLMAHGQHTATDEPARPGSPWGAMGAAA